MCIKEKCKNCGKCKKTFNENHEENVIDITDSKDYDKSTTKENKETN